MEENNFKKSSFYESYIKTNRLLYEDMNFDSKDEKLLYINMHFFADKDGYLFPGVKKLAEMGHCSRSTIFKVLAKLESKGYIKIFRKHNETNIYKIIKLDEKEIREKSKTRSRKDLIMERVKMEQIKDKLFEEVVKSPVYPVQNKNFEVLKNDVSGTNQGHELYSFNSNLINIPEGSSAQGSEDKKSKNSKLNSESKSGLNWEAQEAYDHRKNITEIELEKKEVLFHEIVKLIQKGTGVGEPYVANTLITGSLTTVQLGYLKDKIKESDFLMGKLEKKPTLKHFSSRTQLFRIIGGYYQNRMVLKSNLPCYEIFKKDEEESERYEPIY